MTVIGPRGERTIPAADFFHGFLTTALEPDEVLTEIAVPILPEGTGSSFMEVSRRHGDFAMVGVAATVTMVGSTVTDVRIALSGVGDTPVRASDAESILRSQTPTKDSLAAVARTAAHSLDPPSDVHASGLYRKHVAEVLTTRALTTAVHRAGGPVQ
jgi:CO/xanthine dehydrogenase FAD-binding subunit